METTFDGPLTPEGRDWPEYDCLQQRIPLPPGKTDQTSWTKCPSNRMWSSSSSCSDRFFHVSAPAPVNKSETDS